MARLPLDPRLSRALLESKRFHAQRELLAIVSGLSVPDVRMGDDPAAGAAFDDSKSEFSGLLKLWSAYRMAREGPRRELRRWCKERQLSLLRLSEWDDVYTQVVDRARDLGIVAQTAEGKLHRRASLLAGGLLHHGRVARRGRRVHGNARRAFSYLPGFAAGPPASSLGHGGQHRRDFACVCAACRGNRADVDRGRCVASGQAGISGAGLG